jgi:hypothetical protein
VSAGGDRGGDIAAGESPLLGWDPERPMIHSAWGAKRSGKSELNRVIYRSWPYDRLVIDVNGNADPGEDAEKITADDGRLPTRFPERITMPGEPRRPRSLWYRAHPGEGTRVYREHLDQAVGMALYPQHKRVCLWAGEVGELQPNGRPGPHMRTLLMQNRHYNVTALFDGPRPTYVDPLTLHQSDYVSIFLLPNPADRKRIAESIGFPPKRFDEACHSAWREVGDDGTPHGFLLWDSNRRKLYEHEALPLELIKDAPESGTKDAAA